MKKLISLLLVLVLVLGMVPMASAAQSMNTMQKALLETALAYYNRGPGVQYDSQKLTNQGKYEGDGADLRETDFASPEDGTVQDICYCVCSSYMFEIYYDAFNYQISGSPLQCKTFKLEDLPESDPIVVFKYNEKTGENKEMGREAAIKKIRSLLQPGDVIVGCNLKDSGHTQMYLGDFKGDGTHYMIHCWGSKYDIKTGNDPKELTFKDAHPDGGAIRLQDIDAHNFALDGTGTYPLIKQNNFVLLRPLNVLKESDLTASAKARLQYSGMSIDRQADYNKFSSVEQGKDVTVTLKVQNTSAAAYKGLPITEKLPENCTFKSSDGTFKDGIISWTADIPAGETKTFTFTVTATGEVGSVIDLSHGNVGGIRSNRIPVTIHGKGLTAEQVTALQSISKSRSQIEKLGLTGDAFAEKVYEVLGMQVDLPSLQEVADTCFTASTVEGADYKMLILNEKASTLTANPYFKMLIPDFFGGILVKADPKERLLTYMEGQLQPGDIVMAAKNFRDDAKRELSTWVYQGGGRIAMLSEKDRLLSEKASLLELLLTYDFFVGLRPSLAYADLNKALAPVAFTDVAAGSWYYTFVRDLVAAGTVSGMTATTYAPNGNLTYGQALKLITLSAGEKEQPAGAHWASGYLTLAKEKGWLASDVDLNANITRLAFCQIAAKAAKLTEQPASNPFKDTADTSVLALVKAGVISGMSADTFAPEGLLTRAQIAKIIWCLQQL